MNRWLGISFCWLLRCHRWRRLRKAEREAFSVTQRFYGQEDSEQMRICERCGATRLAKRRKAMS